jgi:type I restriction enzyme S subunit
MICRKATAQPSLSMATIRDVNVAFPPLAEQKRIVTKVDGLMPLCDELESRLLKSQTDCDRLMEAAVADILAA